MQHLGFRALRLAGAIAILAVGAVHLQQYLGAGYQKIPTIGWLFLLNAIGSAAVGIPLLLPVERVLADRRGHLAVAGLATSALAIAIGSFVALLISESGSLFGFSESGYRAPIVIAIVAEALTVLLLGPVAAVSLARSRSGNRQALRPRSGSRRERLDYGGAP